MQEHVLLELDNVTHFFERTEGRRLKVLEHINMQLRAGEIVALLGKSGAGKSTLLRVIAGLIQPNHGVVKFLGQKLSSSASGIAMVFQTFALFPWLTVLENVELGLEALGMPPGQIRKYALEGIDRIGLDGYESAYPRELSGGMKQRVGFARAFVVKPKILLMDEPFSELDVLTAQTLKSDFLDLWLEGKMSIQSTVLVTHNIEEAVFLSDRILLMSSEPGRIATEIDIKSMLPHPRDRHSPEFRQMVEDIYTLMLAKGGGNEMISDTKLIAIDEKLPRVSPNQLAGLMETLLMAPYHGRADLPILESVLQTDTEHVLHLVEVLQILKFAAVIEGDVVLTEAGKNFVAADTLQQKKIFSEHLIPNVPLASYIVRVLSERPDSRASRLRFLTHLEDRLSGADADQTLAAVTSWGRYAEIFAYDDNTKTFSLENPIA